MPLIVNESQLPMDANSFMTVRHLILKGTSREIGKHLASLGQSRHNVHPRRQPSEALRIRCQREYIESRYSLHFERMKGIADAYGLKVDDDEWDFNSLMYYMEPFGCSAVYYPPATTRSGQGLLSRNFDFSLQTIHDQEATEENPAVVSNPYVMEIYPDDGYASLSMCNYDLANGVLDGINETGLVVTILADDESARTYPREPAFTRQVGLHELQIMRLILDTCATVEEAKQALLSHRLYYAHIPLHYMIADRSGNSFVFEHSYTNNRYHILDGGTKPFIVSNFLLHRYEDGTPLPEDDNQFGMYTRYNKLKEKIASHADPLFSEIDAQTNNRCAYIDSSCDIPSRTLWHTVYNTGNNSMTVDFYMKDLPEGCARSETFTFQLKSNR
ncbi:Acyl-coenzyme A:6-aminopenicillanic acid acyl-transferase [compost metagenome]